MNLTWPALLDMSRFDHDLSYNFSCDDMSLNLKIFWQTFLIATAHFSLLQVDILINVLKNLKGNDKLDGIQYLLVSINTIKTKWSPILSQRAITSGAVATPNTTDQTLANFFKTKRHNSKLIFNAKSLNTLWISQFFRRTMSEFVFEKVNLTVPSLQCQRAVTNNSEENDKIVRSITSGSGEVHDGTPKESQQKNITKKKKQHSTYKCVLCEKRSVLSRALPVARMWPPESLTQRLVSLRVCSV